MSEPSPSERELSTGTLILFGGGEPDERGPVSPAEVAAQPALAVQVLLRDVRNTNHAQSDRRAWLARAWTAADSLGFLPWFSLHLALVRHAVLVADPGERERAAGRARALVEALHDRPEPAITDADSTLRDALRRAQRALRVPILAQTIKLDIGDVVPRLLETAASDRTTDDISRRDVLLRIIGGVRRLKIDDQPVVELLVAAGASPSLYRSSVHDAWFKREAARTYLERPIYEYDRIPTALWHQRINARKLTRKEHW